MKKILALFLTVVLLFPLTGCSSGKAKTDDTDEPVGSSVPVKTEEKDAADVFAPEKEAKKKVDDGADGKAVKTAAQLSDIAEELPESSSEFSMTLARHTLSLCTGHMQEKEARLLTDEGFELVCQVNYDKETSDPSHTCAYSVGRKQIKYEDRIRPLIIVAIRGTDAGEWYSNFDFAPSHSDSTSYAENFLMCAQDVYDGLESVLSQETEPVILVCGHSRGAACANLLGLLLNRQYGTEDTFVYTFATPCTFRGGEADADCSNIFNIINPADVVTKVPLAAWGFVRLGQDIVLPGNADVAAMLDAMAASVISAAPTISQYYTLRHSLTSPGLADDGVTAFELMTSMTGSIFAVEGEGDASGDMLSGISQESDLWGAVQLLQSIQTVGLQHMPLAYQALMAAMSASGALLPTE